MHFPVGEASIATMTDDKVKRRLTTVLCADVYGYSRLMEADEHRTLHLLDADLPLMAAGILPQGAAHSSDCRLNPEKSSDAALQLGCDVAMRPAIARSIDSRLSIVNVPLGPSAHV